MAYEKCIEVSEEIWKEFGDLQPQEITARTGVVFQEGGYHLPFLDRTLRLFPYVRPCRLVQVAGAPGAEPGFRVCLTALMYLLHLDPVGLGRHQPPGITGGGDVFPGPPRPARRPVGGAFRAGRGRVFGRREKTSRRDQTCR